MTDAGTYSGVNIGRWSPYVYGGASNGPRNNHMQGTNVVFVDGHGEWRNRTDVKPRIQFYYGWIYW